MTLERPTSPHRVPSMGGRGALKRVIALRGTFVANCFGRHVRGWALGHRQKSMRYLLLFVCLTLSGCLTYDESKAAAFAANGLASIRGSNEWKARFMGPKILRYLVTTVDDPFVEVNRFDVKRFDASCPVTYEILPLTPGERHVKATAYIRIPRRNGYDCYLFQSELSLSAIAGRRYEIRGECNETHAALWICDIDENKQVSLKVEGTPALTNSFRSIPLFIYIPPL